MRPEFRYFAPIDAGGGKLIYSSDKTALTDLEKRKDQAFRYYQGLVRVFAQKTGQPEIKIFDTDYTKQIVSLVREQDRKGRKEEAGEENFKLAPTQHGAIILFPERNIAVSPLLPEDEMVELTPTESALLKQLMSRPSEVHTHQALVDAAWGIDDPDRGDKNLLKTHMSHLRQKLGVNVKYSIHGEKSGEAQLIYSIPRLGYSLSPRLDRNLLTKSGESR